MTKFQKKLWMGIGILALLSPIGIILPEKFKAGDAWGEWGTHELSRMGLKAIPSGLENLSTLWGAPLSGYNLPVLGNTNLGYVLSALTGIVIIGLISWLFTLLLTTKTASKSTNK